MSVFLFIELEREISRFRDRFDGKPLAHAQSEIDSLAKRLGLTPLCNFMSMSQEKAAELAEFTPELADVDFATTWYEATDGLRTCEALLDYFAKHPDDLAAFEHPDDVRDDLVQAARTLAAAQKAGVRFFLDCAY